MSWKIPRLFAEDCARAEAEVRSLAPAELGLGARLAFVFSRVRPGSRVADVGTDHGSLPRALLAAGRVERAIGIDLAPGPLARAAAAGGGVETRLGSGLSPLAPGEVDTVCLAGLGGRTIAALLGRGAPAGLGVTRVIAQPNTEPAEVRIAAVEAGFEVVEERFVAEGRRLFLVIVADRALGPSPAGLSDEERRLGPARARTEDAAFRAWLHGQALRTERLARRRGRPPGPPPAPRLASRRR